MIPKKKLIAAVLAALCATSALFMVIPIRSPTTDGEYDPWIDTNDDGIINYKDLGNLATRFGALGTPINKTDLLLELQNSLDSLNDTLIELQSTIETLEANIETRIDTLNSTLGNLLPNNETYSETLETISGYPAMFNWQDMADMAVEITLETNATLLIMFSAQALTTQTWLEMHVRAMIDSTPAHPPTGVILTKSNDWASYSYTFYSPKISTGTYTVRIQWKLNDEVGSGQVRGRTLTVIVLPAS